MKKIISYLLVMMLFVPFVVKADMGAPIVRSYKAEVVKEEGVDYYSYDENLKKAGHLDKGAVIEVDFEERINGVDYLTFYKKDNSYYIKAEDVINQEKEVTPKSKNVDKEDYAVKYKINADKVDVRKGPSVTYEIVGTLPKDTTGEYRYHIEESGYIYVEAKGLKGWIDTLEGAVLFEGGDFILAEANKTDKCGTIPANTIVKDTWITDPWTGDMLVTYKGCSDFVNYFKNDYIITVDKDTYLGTTSSETKLYATVEKKKVLATIPANTEVEQITTDGFFEYGDEDKGHKDDLLVYVNYKGQKGWAYMPRDEYPDGPEAEDPQEPEEEEEEEDIAEQESEPVSDETLDCDDELDCEESVDRTNIALICAIVGVAIAGAAAITIIIVNKKKKEKAPEAPVTEAPVEEAKVEEVKEETKKEE